MRKSALKCARQTARSTFDGMGSCGPRRVLRRTSDDASLRVPPAEVVRGMSRVRREGVRTAQPCRGGAPTCARGIGTRVQGQERVKDNTSQLTMLLLMTVVMGFGIWYMGLADEALQAVVTLVMGVMHVYGMLESAAVGATSGWLPEWAFALIVIAGLWTMLYALSANVRRWTRWTPLVGAVVESSARRRRRKAHLDELRAWNATNHEQNIPALSPPEDAGEATNGVTTTRTMPGEGATCDHCKTWQQTSVKFTRTPEGTWLARPARFRHHMVTMPTGQMVCSGSGTPAQPWHMQAQVKTKADEEAEEKARAEALERQAREEEARALRNVDPRARSAPPSGVEEE